MTIHRSPTRLEFDDAYNVVQERFQPAARSAVAADAQRLAQIRHKLGGDWVIETRAL
jgi:hypothetical protein